MRGTSKGFVALQVHNDPVLRCVHFLAGCLQRGVDSVGAAGAPRICITRDDVSKRNIAIDYKHNLS